VCEYLVGQGADVNIKNKVSTDRRMLEQEEDECDVILCRSNNRLQLYEFLSSRQAVDGARPCLTSV
jgi:hypothetical protein